MSSDLNLASLGTATGTTVDSPAEHIMACKMVTNYLISLLKFTATQNTDAYTLLHDNKMRWCMHKHELALFTGKKLCPGSTFTGSNPKAYPLVITTVGDMHQYTKHFLANLYNQPTPYDFYHLCALLSNQIGLGPWHSTPASVATVFGDQHISGLFVTKLAEAQTKDEMTVVIRQVDSTPDFRCQGVALGQAWASHISGDTVASVMVGGVHTVQNGAFPMQTGDMVQWYFDFEEPMFETKATNKQGERTDAGNFENGAHVEGRMGRKRQYMDQKTFGVGKGYGQQFQQIKDTRGVVRIKSYKYRPTIYDINGSLVRVSCNESFGDKIRIFAKCISGGRPYDQVDIMMMTQSL